MGPPRKDGGVERLVGTPLAYPTRWMGCRRACSMQRLDLRSNDSGDSLPRNYAGYTEGGGVH